jgi:hypothetical protein
MYLFTISDGKIYRCPFASSADRLNALAHNDLNYARLDSSSNDFWDYLCDIDFIPASMHCKGRSWDSPIIKAAVQIRTPLPYKQ